MLIPYRFGRDIYLRRIVLSVDVLSLKLGFVPVCTQNCFHRHMHMTEYYDNLVTEVFILCIM